MPRTGLPPILQLRYNRGQFVHRTDTVGCYHKSNSGGGRRNETKDSFVKNDGIKERTCPNMKRAAICIVCIILMLPVFGCQPTPTEEAVVNRGDGTLEGAILADPLDPYSYEAPDRWEETYEVREQEIRISAEIELPDSELHPVITVKRRAFSANDVLLILRSVSSGDWSVRESEYSRDELMQDLENVSKGAFVDVDPETGELIWEPYEGQQEEMERLQALIEKTPTEDTYVPVQADNLAIPINRRRVKDGTGTTWYLSAKSQLITLDRYRDGSVQMENWVMQGDATPGEKAHPLYNIQISETEAIQKGDAMIDALGFRDFRLADTQKARDVQDYTYTVLGEGYWLTYVPALDGAIPCYYGNSVDPDFLYFTQGDGVTYAPDWPQEHIQMFVTEEGILFLSWAAPKETVLTANTNVRLLPFDEIQKNVKKLLEYGTGGEKGSPILVKRMVLTTAVAQIPNQGDEAFLVPTWAIFLTSELNERLNIDMGVLLINALDGTYINRFGQP